MVKNKIVQRVAGRFALADQIEQRLAQARRQKKLLERIKVSPFKPGSPKLKT